MAYVPITPCSVDTSVISQLPNEPVSPEYTAAQFKAAFDSAGTGLKDYVNTTLASYVNNLAQIIEGYIEYTLPDNSVTTAKIVDSQVTRVKINTNAVNEDKLAGNCIKQRHLQANTLAGSFLKDNSTNGVKIVTNTLDGTKILDNSITSAKIQSVAATKITGQLGANQIAAVNANCISGTVPASQLEVNVSVTDVSGNWPTSRIEGDYDATRLSGTIDVNRIESLPTTKLTGTLTVNKITSNGGAELTLNDVAGVLSSSKGGYAYNDWKASFVTDRVTLATNNYGTADPTGTPNNGTLYFKILSS